MATVALNVDLIVDMPTSSASAKLRSVSDSSGADLTTQFHQYCLKEQSAALYTNRN
jgi:hypothetical protein